MRSILLLAAGAGAALGGPLASRQNGACFIIGSETLPESVISTVSSIQNSITCNPSVKTLSGVPDVTSGSVSFSSVNFADSDLSPLEFALTTFAASDPLADTDLQTFEDRLNVYLATEAGIRSVGGGLAIKVPKFFLEFQVSRIRTAQGNAPTEAGLQVDHLLGKVLKNGAGEDKALLDQVTALAAKLS